ncbi:guanylate kinase [Alicyclobacillus contaminans]|uniref:guanylate kinase n=1 Tax=Alicyclobacillus contaminans TaxID=392016 RepID=UPI00047B7B35|nr:guanylate kinase [Alicyclobacillus contaminans]GMA49333.1 guanylate kinase [Alicyclobacillus contaminans]
MYQIIVFQGPSGSGKTTLQQKLDVPRVITWTTRPPRDGEKDGEDYFFVSVEKFKSTCESGKMLETTEYKSNFYGTPLEAILEPKYPVQSIVLDRNGASKIKELLKDRCLRVGVYAPKADCEMRLKNRQPSAEVLQQRMADYEQEVSELTDCDLVINNSNQNWSTSGLFIELLRKYLKKQVEQCSI